MASSSSGTHGPSEEQPVPWIADEPPVLATHRAPLNPPLGGGPPPSPGIPRPARAGR